MITEDYVSFEIAKLLKEKGFDEKLFTCYVTDKDKKEGCFLIMSFTDDKIDNNHSDLCYSAPTLQMTMKWLREVHKAFISIIYENDGVFTANLKVPLKGVDCMIDNKHNCWLTYEEAVEASIKYCLENLV
jgi:hypothetical protein